MPIVLCDASKATPYKGLAYILDKEKTLAAGNQGFATLANDPKALAEQMMFTMTIHGKGGEVEERKYYHCKVSFHPDDLPENGGTLTVKKAYSYAMEYAAATWPGREVVWSIQKHGRAMHIHFIVAAVEQATGKKLDARDAEYRRWKKRANDLAMKRGLSTLDWEKATAEKRAAEQQSDLPVKETFAERDMKRRGKTSWKDELREKIDAAAAKSRTLEEFKTKLQASGVTLTRCTEQTISYKLGEHKACRGDTLGGDYTAAAIRSALERNSIEPAAEEGKDHAGLDSVIGYSEQKRAAGGFVPTAADREFYRALGRALGVTRAEVDDMLDNLGPAATWEEKKTAWDAYQAAKASFWEEYKILQQDLRNELNAAYRHRKWARNAEWALNPRNRRKSLIGVLCAFIVLRRYGRADELSADIEFLQKKMSDLRNDMATFKYETGMAVETLRKKGLSLDEYMAHVKGMQEKADTLVKQTQWMSQETRDALQQQAEKGKKKSFGRS